MTHQRMTQHDDVREHDGPGGSGAREATAIAAPVSDCPPASLDAPLIGRAARSECTLLITGETGVGKGHLAKWLHQQSSRRNGAFIPVNCGAIPEALIDSQLFGHARGAFTDARREHLGLVRAAEGGTLLLDEVSELPATAQTRLLRLLQEREVHPVGHSRPVPVDVRVIAATNVHLHELVEERRFREDLYFRLDVIRLNVPPLRERPAEMERLLDRFNREFGGLYRQEPLPFRHDAMQILRDYHWPGNIRQLRTLVERLHVLCPGEEITPTTLARLGQLGGTRQTLGDGWRLEHVKIEEVNRVLSEAGGSVSKAAAALGVHRSTIYRWLQQHGGR